MKLSLLVALFLSSTLSFSRDDIGDILSSKGGDLKQSNCNFEYSAEHAICECSYVLSWEVNDGSTNSSNHPDSFDAGSTSDCIEICRRHCRLDR